MKKALPIIKPLVFACSVALAACGSSGGGGTTTTTTVTGTAEAPGGVIAQFENNKSYLVAAIEYTFPAAIAGITGLQPVTGATVELIRIDDDGNQVGDVLATTSTSVTGDYSLGLPSGVSLAGNLVVRITGNGGASMSAMVVDQAVDINPISQFVLDKFVDDDNLILADLAINEVVALSGKVDEFDLTAGADLTAMLDILEAEVGQFVDNEIAVIQATPDDGTAAAAVAGVWHTVEFGLGMHDDEASSFGTFSMDILSEEITLVDAGNGVVNLQIGPALLDVYANISNNNFTSFNIYHQISLGEAGEVFPATIDANSNLTLSFPFEEELQTPAPGDLDGPDFGWRYPPGTEFIYPVANGNTYVTVFTEAEVRYETIDTNNDGIKDAINPAARSGDEVSLDLLMMLKQGSGMSTASLNGDYGMVAFNVNVDSAAPESVFDSTVGILNFNAGTVSRTANAFDVVEVTRAPATPPAVTLTPAAFTEPTSPDSFPYTVSATGQVTLTPGDTLEGYTNNDGTVIAIVDDVATGSPDITNVNEEMLLMLKLGTGMASSLNGATYKMFPMSFNTSADGFSEIFTLDGDVTFSADSTAATVTGTDRGVERSTDIAQIAALAETVSSNFTVSSVTDNGEITMTATEVFGSETFTTTLKGFVSADTNMLVLRLYSSNQVSGVEYDMGIVVGVKQ